MKLTRIDDNYAWGECSKKRNKPVYNKTTRKCIEKLLPCLNTVKFGEDGSEGCCPACSTLYICKGKTAKKIGYIEHDHTNDYDQGIRKLI